MLFRLLAVVSMSMLVASISPSCKFFLAVASTASFADFLLPLPLYALTLVVLPLLSLACWTGMHRFSGGGAFANWIFSNLCGCTVLNLSAGAVALLDLVRKPCVFCSWAGLTGCSGGGASACNRVDRVDRDDDITGMVMGCYE
jgi:hypothetical protein